MIKTKNVEPFNQIEDGIRGIGIDWKGSDNQINTNFYECQDRTKANALKVSEPFAAIKIEDNNEPVK